MMPKTLLPFLVQDENFLQLLQKMQQKHTMDPSNNTWWDEIFHFEENDNAAEEIVVLEVFHIWKKTET